MYRKTLCLCLFCLMTAGLCFSQNVVKGVLLDSETNEPIIGATIVNAATKVGDVSKLDGSFLLKVSQGNVVLDITYVGYTQVSQKVTVSGSTTDLGTIYLKSDAIGLGDVTVTASMPWRIVDEAEKLRMTKAIACAIKSQAALYKASKLYCGDQNYWKEAYDINQDCFNQLKQHGYELYTKMQTSNYNCAYAEYFVQNGSFSTNPVDKETIWQSDFGEESMAYVWGTPLQGNYRCGTCPSQNLVDAYDMLATGKPIYHLDKPYLDDQGLQVNVDNTSGYNASKPYSGRDPRMDATVLHDGSSIYLAGKKVAVQTFTGGNCEMQSGSTRYSETGYYPFKGEYWNSGDGVAIQDGRWKYYRLGEIYLNYAEAAAEVGTPESIQKAMELVNTIRHRAGFDPSVDVSAPDKATAILIVRHERQVELAYEEHRYFDMRRWTSANEDLTNEKFTVGMKITKKGLGRVYERFVINSKDGVTPTKLSYLAKWHFWPISATEASTMESKTGDNWQNEGW